MENSRTRPEIGVYPACIRDVTPAAVAALSTPLKSSAECEVVVTLLERTVARQGSQAALERGDVTVSYCELWRKAMSVSGMLAAEGLEHSDIVAVHGSMSPEMCISAIGVLLARGVLLLVDRSLPDMRKRRMIEIANAGYLLNLEGAGKDVQWLPELTRQIDLRNGIPALDRPGWSSSTPCSEDAAYIFFTSGSTGVPKGVMGTHRGLAHFIVWQGSEFRIAPTDRVAQVTNPSFDVVLREILLPLTRGACLVFPMTDLRREPGEAISWFGHKRNLDRPLGAVRATSLGPQQQEQRDAGVLALAVFSRRVFVERSL